MVTEQKILFKIGNNLEFAKTRKAIANVDSNLCVNCGRCRMMCPTETINEYQRDICRLCPDCAEGPMLFPEQSKTYTAEHSCSLSCPLGTIPEGYVNLIAEGKFDLAYEMISDLNPLPVICSMICHHPCEDDCKRGLLMDKPIAIRALKRYVIEHEKPAKVHFNQRYDKKIAIIGAGPAGLTAAADLALKGYRVKIFEASSKPGGMMGVAIPEFRLDKDKLRNEIQELIDAGVEIEYNCRIGRNPTLEELRNDKYAAILIAVGSEKGCVLPIPGADSENVYDAVSIMKKINSKIPVKLGNKAVIIGGGSVALDTARTLKRKGVGDITCVCLEAGNFIPAPKWELEEAFEEGIKLIEGASPIRIIADLFTVNGIEFKKVKSIETDESGKLKPVTEDGSEFVVAADTVVFATGQKPDIRFLIENSGLKLNKAGYIEFAEGTGQTNISTIFVAGDVTGAKGSVVSAMADGRKAALSIDNMLMDRKLENRAVKREPKTASMKEKIYPVRLEKLDPQNVPKLRYRDNFEMVEGVYDDKSAVLEAKRCMKCGFSEVDTDNCIGCGVCVEACPEKAITMIKVL